MVMSDFNPVRLDPRSVDRERRHQGGCNPKEQPSLPNFAQRSNLNKSGIVTGRRTVVCWMFGSMRRRVRLALSLRLLFIPIAIQL